MNAAESKTEPPRSTQLREARFGGALMALLALLVTTSLGVAVAAPATDGEGMMSVSPASATYGSTDQYFHFYVYSQYR